MKLVKLSLIAAMATGVIATTASAVPLEEAIKDVDVSGYTRLRYTHDKDKSENPENRSKSAWNFKGELNIKTKIDDNFFAVVGIRYLDEDKGESSSTSLGKNDDFDLHRAYFGYAVGNTAIQVGRQDVGAFFTDDMYGDGIKVLNSDIEGLTLAALWMDSLEADGDIGSNGSIKDFGLGNDEKTNAVWLATGGKNGGKKVTDHNLYGVAAIGNYDPVSFQIWYAALEDVTDLFAVELAASFDITDDFNLSATAQYGFSDFDGKFKDAIKKGTSDKIEIGDADFYGIELGTEFFGVDFTAGYVDFSTDKGKTSLISFEDSGSFIKPGEELFDYTLFEGENNYWFVTAGYTIPDTGVRIGADYLDGENKTKDGVDTIKTDMKEVVGRVEYAHSDKLKFKTWYSHVKEGDDKADRVRFEAKYSF